MPAYNVYNRRMEHIGEISAPLIHVALAHAREELGVGVAVSRQMDKSQQAALAAKRRNEELDAIIAQM